jgi:hypothetical protein
MACPAQAGAGGRLDGRDLVYGHSNRVAWVPTTPLTIAMAVENARTRRKPCSTLPKTSGTRWPSTASGPTTGFGAAGFTSSSHLVLGTALVVRLLVAEDEPRLAALLRRGFQEEGYAVDVSGDGVDAEWMAREVDYATVVLDVMLPGRDEARRVVAGVVAVGGTPRSVARRRGADRRG